MKDANEAVSRVVRRRAKPGCEQAYETLVHGMLKESSHFPGYLSSVVIPPEEPRGEYQIVQRFATQQDLDRWNASDERAAWHERLLPVADNDPVYRMSSGLEVWFSPKLFGPTAPPSRWRMTVVSWLGIYPTVAVFLWLVSPLLEFLPFLLRIAMVTAMVAITMSYIVMPRLSKWLNWWIKKHS